MAGSQSAWPLPPRRRSGGLLTRLLGQADPPDADPQMSVMEVGGTSIVVLRGVFNGIRFHTGAFLAETLMEVDVVRGSSVLDLGTGSGVCAVFAARVARRVLATDINPLAVRCAAVNALAHGLEGIVETRVGDLFAPVAGERFDLVLFNPPYFRGAPRDAADQALRSPDAFDRFLSGVGEHLTGGGRALVVLSPDTDVEEAMWTVRHLAVARLRTRRVLGKTLSIYELRPR